MENKKEKIELLKEVLDIANLQEALFSEVKEEDLEDARTCFNEHLKTVVIKKIEEESKLLIEIEVKKLFDAPFDLKGEFGGIIEKDWNVRKTVQKILKENLQIKINGWSNSKLETILADQFKLEVTKLRSEYDKIISKEVLDEMHNYAINKLKEQLKIK